MPGTPISGNFGIEMPLTVVAPKTRGSKRVWYKPNHRSFGAFMRSDQMRDVTVRVAVDIAVLAGRLSPRSEGPGPHMADEFEVKREAGLMKVGGNLRVKVEIVNNNEAAAVNEFGGPRNTRRRMLGRAGAQFGDFKPQEHGPRIAGDTQESGPLL